MELRTSVLILSQLKHSLLKIYIYANVYHQRFKAWEKVLKIILPRFSMCEIKPHPVVGCLPLVPKVHVPSRF